MGCHGTIRRREGKFGNVVSNSRGGREPVWVPGGVAGELRNDGQEPAVGLVFLVGEAGMFSEGGAEATPAS